MKFNIIGAGRLGKTLAKRLVSEGHELNCIVNQSEKSTRAAKDFIGAGNITTTYENITISDVTLTLITAPDDAIAKVSQDLVDAKKIPEKSIVLHCSGSLTSDDLSAHKAVPYYPVSAHLNRSFAHPKISYEQFKGTFCAIEGHSEAVLVMSELLTSIGAEVFHLDKNKKVRYHSSAVMASNYLVALFDASIKGYIEAGIAPSTAFKIVNSLMSGTLDNIMTTQSTQKALTGPIARADIETLKKHRDDLCNTSNHMLHNRLAHYTITELTQHSDELKDRLHKTVD